MKKLAEHEEAAVQRAMTLANKRYAECLKRIETAESELKELHRQRTQHEAQYKEFMAMYQIKRVSRDKFAKLWGIHRPNKLTTVKM